MSVCPPVPEAVISLTICNAERKIAMKKTTRLVSLFAASLLAALSLASCGGGESSAPASDSGSTPASTAESSGEESAAAPAETLNPDEALPACKMTVWLAGSGEAIYNDVYTAILDSWVENRAPGSTHELSFIAWTDYFSKLSTGLAGGAAPDVFMTGYGQMGTMNAQGYELNLSDYFPEDWDGWTDIPENILSAGMKDGDLYGLLETNTRARAYRKDIAEQNGVTEEDLTVETLDDLTNLIQKMCVYDDSGNLVMAGCDVQTSTSSPEQWAHFIATNFDPEFEYWNDDNTAAFNSDAMKQAMEYSKSLFDAGYCFPSDPSNTTSGIISGLSSMSLIPESNYTQADMAFPGQIGFVNCTLNTMLIGNFIVANADTPNPAQAADLVMYFFNEDSLKEKATLGQYTLRTSLNDWYVETYPEFENVVTAYEHSTPMASTLNPNYNECIVSFRNHWETYMNGIEDADTALSTAESEWNAIVGG